MNRFSHYAHTVLDRPDGDIRATVELTWEYDEGEYFERGWPPINAGWSCDRLVVRDEVTYELVVTSPAEEDALREKYHPDNLPDPRDQD